MLLTMGFPRNANVFLLLVFSNQLRFAGLIVLPLCVLLKRSWSRKCLIFTMHLKRFGRIGWQNGIRLQGNVLSGMRTREGISVLIPIRVHYGQVHPTIICSSMAREG